MANAKDILVTTTSSLNGIKVIKHLKPVSAHLVAGVNMFNDFLGGLTDIFGGRSNTYQKQLSSLYDEAIEKIKLSAFELGANAVIGLSIDMDEISGKGKSMIMLTAIGTAIVIENDLKPTENTKTLEKFENISHDRIKSLANKRKIVQNAQTEELAFNEEVWEFIISNQLEEVFPFVLKRHSNVIENFQLLQEPYQNFHKNFVSYISSLREEISCELVYGAILRENDNIARYLTKVIKETNLFDGKNTITLLNNTDFKKQKIGLRVAVCDKLFYNDKDVEDFKTIVNLILSNFKERGQKASKKQILSSKEKEIWNCECGNNSVELGEYCGTCGNDIFGFSKSESKPAAIVHFIEEKIDLINEYIK